jgi:hypothetical protein
LSIRRLSEAHFVIDFLLKKALVAILRFHLSSTTMKKEAFAPSGLKPYKTMSSKSRKRRDG